MLVEKLSFTLDILSCDSANLRILAEGRGFDVTAFYHGCDLSGCDLSQQDLRGLTFKGADLRGCNLKDTVFDPGALREAITDQRPTAVFNDVMISRVAPDGRLSLPAAVRMTFEIRAHTGAGDQIYMRLSGTKRCIVLHGDDVPFPSESELSSPSDIIATSKHFTLRKNGKVTIPKALRERAFIGELVAFVGRGRSVEIWSPDELRKIKDGDKEVNREIEDMLLRRSRRETDRSS